MNEPAVNRAFASLAARTLDATMSATQYQESRRFFYMGVYWAIVEFELSADMVDDADGAKAARYMASIKAECEEFNRKIQRGEA